MPPVQTCGAIWLTYGSGDKIMGGYIYVAGGIHVLYNQVQEEGPVKLSSKMVTLLKVALEIRYLQRSTAFRPRPIIPA